MFLILTKLGRELGIKISFVKSDVELITELFRTSNQNNSSNDFVKQHYKQIMASNIFERYAENAIKY